MLHLKIKYEFKLVLVFSFALLLLYAVDKYFTKIEIRKDCAQMSEAISLTERWFNDVGQMKKEKKISNDIRSDTKYNFLIGDEYTNITTTFGSLEAKELSANPEFAALLIKYLTNSNIDSTKTVGIILSGSFPSLSISCLAAIQTLNSKAIIFSSLGASMFGANQPGATWLDIENYLIKSSNLKYKSSLVTVGAEDDNGGGYGNDRPHNIGDHDAEKDLELRSAVHPGSFQELLRDALDGGREQHHGEARLEPEHDDH